MELTNDTIEESLFICPISGLKCNGIHIPISEAKSHSQGFSDIIKAFHEGITHKDKRDAFFQSLSKTYNYSLANGRYEESVASLMMMKVILDQENLTGDSQRFAKIADTIINCAILKEEDGMSKTCRSQS